MADSSNEYKPEEGSTESLNTQNLCRCKAKDDAQVSGENSAKKKQKSGTVEGTRYQEVQKCVEVKIRGNDLVHQWGVDWSANPC